MSNSVRPHRRQPTRLPRPWDSPGKNTGVGCHFLLQSRKVKSESEVAQSCLSLEGNATNSADIISLCTWRNDLYQMRSLPISSLLLLKVKSIKVSQSPGLLGGGCLPSCVCLMLVFCCPGAPRIMAGSVE